MDAKIFISYSSKDEGHVNRIAKLLAEINIEYFLDRKDVHWGDDISTTITSGLADCSALVVILSPASLKSQRVPFEIGYATALGLRILPYLVHPSLDLPGYLRNYHFKMRLRDIKDYFVDYTSGPKNALPRAIQLSDQLGQFKARFAESTMDNYINLLFEAEDLLLKVIGQERYNDLHIFCMNILQAEAKAGIATKQGDNKEATDQKTMAEEFFRALKLRVKGIEA